VILRKGLGVRREWELGDLIECWTLDEVDVGLLANKSGATRLGFALLLKVLRARGQVSPPCR
jgi:hypothetical protein